MSQINFSIPAFRGIVSLSSDVTPDISTADAADLPWTVEFDSRLTHLVMLAVDEMATDANAKASKIIAALRESLAAECHGHLTALDNLIGELQAQSITWAARLGYRLAQIESEGDNREWLAGALEDFGIGLTKDTVQAG